MIKVGEYNLLKVAREVSFGLYLDDGAEGIISSSGNDECLTLQFDQFFVNIDRITCQIDPSF